MVSINQLMEYGTRRKIEEIARKMGHPPAEEYPDEVLTAVVRQTQGPSVSRTAYTAAEGGNKHEAEADLAAVQQAAESRAAGLLVAMDALTMHYCATREFSDPRLQQAVDESQDRLKSMLVGVGVYYDPDNFLSQTPLVPATGRRGLTSSRKSKKESSASSSAIIVPSDAVPKSD